MSIQFPGSAGNYLSRVTCPDINANYTITCWVRPETINISDFFIFTFAGTTTGPDADQLYHRNNGDWMSESVLINGSETQTDGGAFVNGTWYFLAFRRTAVTNLDFWVDTAVACTVASDVTGRAATSPQITVGCNVGFGGLAACRIAQMRVWTTNLSDGELATEKASATAVKATNLWAEWRMVNLAAAGDDSSGNTRPLTITGTLTTGADDPVQGGGTGLMWL